MRFLPVVSGVQILSGMPYARLTEAAFGRVLKTLCTVMSRMGIDPSVWRQLTGVRGAIKPQNSSS